MLLFRDSIHDTIYGEQISNNIWKDNNGQLICENVVLARTGYYDYREDEIIEGGSPDKIIRVYRSEEEVFDPVSMKSMNYKPLVDEHPEDNVTPDTVGVLQKGFMTNVRRGTGEFKDCLMADLIVTDPVVIEEILSKQKRDLSVGYTADIGETDGQYFMKNIRGNHIALCEAGRAGNARIRDSIDVKDGFNVGYGDKVRIGSVMYEVVGKSNDGATYVFEVISGGKAGERKTFTKSELSSNGAEYVKDADSVSVSDEKKVWEVIILENGETDSIFVQASSESNARKAVAKQHSKAEILEVNGGSWVQRIHPTIVTDFEAKGSFNSINELKSHYSGASFDTRGRDVIVKLSSGIKLLYTYLSGTSGKLLFVRKVNDSIRDSVEVLGDAIKLRVGQRVDYYGTPCVISNISPNLGLKQFLVEFRAGNVLCGRHSYDEVTDYVNQGKIKLLDSVVFDSDTGEFSFEPVEDCDGGDVVFEDSKFKPGDIIQLDGDPETVDKIIQEMTFTGKVVPKYVMKSGRKYLAEDVENGWRKVRDTAAVLKPFRVSVGGRKFDTRATSAAEAFNKVRDALSTERAEVTDVPDLETKSGRS